MQNFYKNVVSLAGHAKQTNYADTRRIFATAAGFLSPYLVSVLLPLAYLADVCTHCSRSAYNTNERARKPHARKHTNRHTLHTQRSTQHTRTHQTTTHINDTNVFVCVCNAWRMQQAGHKRRWRCLSSLVLLLLFFFLHTHNHTSLSEWRGYRSEGDVDVRFTFARVVEKVCVCCVDISRVFACELSTTGNK